MSANQPVIEQHVLVAAYDDMWSSTMPLMKFCKLIAEGEAVLLHNLVSHHATFSTQQKSTTNPKLSSSKKTSSEQQLLQIIQSQHVLETLFTRFTDHFEARMQFLEDRLEYVSDSVRALQVTATSAAVMNRAGLKEILVT